jgi:hypothetical protein
VIGTSDANFRDLKKHEIEQRRQQFIVTVDELPNEQGAMVLRPVLIPRPTGVGTRIVTFLWVLDMGRGDEQHAGNTGGAGWRATIPFWKASG